MSITAYQETDLPGVLSIWNDFWIGAPRAFVCGAEEFARSVVECSAFGESRLLVSRNAVGVIDGFVHFGPREDWWFQLRDRGTPQKEVGSIYAICGYESGLASLLRTAEVELAARGATQIRLWPTWAQGAVPFYNGVMPSYEASGLWAGHWSVRVALDRGYKAEARYRLGSLPLVARHQAGNDRFDWLDFDSPLLPGAKRLRIFREDAPVATAIALPATERNRVLSTREWAAFDVAVDEAYRGQGWGRKLMGRLMSCVFDEGGRSIQLHVVAGNAAAEALYFGSFGFERIDGADFLTLRKELQD